VEWISVKADKTGKESRGRARDLYKGYTVSNKPGEGDKTEQSADSETQDCIRIFYTCSYI